jgi:hypothetical protein
MVAIFKNIVSKETRLKFFVHAINTSIFRIFRVGFSSFLQEKATGKKSDS